GADMGNTGTLIVWTEIDRLIWYKASTLIDNSELLIGRMYRKFLHQGKTKIRLAAFDIDNPTSYSIDKNALPNDPCYLMENTSCPEPYRDTPLFESFGEEARFTINFHDENHEVLIKFSYAKDEVRAHP